MKELDVHFTPEQETLLAQIATKEDTDAERLVRDAALRLLEGDAPLNMKSRLQKVSPWEIGLFAVGCFLMGYGLVICAMQQWPNLVTLPRLTIVIGVVCIVIVLWRFAQETGKHKTGSSLLDDHEDRSKERYCLWQGRLDKYLVHVDVKDDDDLKKLAAKLDVQFKLEDFLLRFREAEHAKLKLWGTVFTAGIVSLIVALLNSLFHKGPL